jgi:hypothetical protein
MLRPQPSGCRARAGRYGRSSKGGRCWRRPYPDCGINVQEPHSQALYSYLANDLTIQNSQGYGDIDLNEFGAIVDLDLHNNIFSYVHTAGFGLDFGTFFFQYHW